MAPDNSASDDLEGEDWDPAVSMSHVRYPSSLGMTFAVSTAMTTVILVQPEAARYEPLEQTDETPEESAPDAGATDPAPLGRRARQRHRPGWRRIPLKVQPVALDVTQATEGNTHELEVGLSLFSRIRPVDESGHASVTLVLINTRSSRSSPGRDANSYFQPKLRVVAGSGEPAFVHRRGAATPATDEDAQLAQAALSQHSFHRDRSRHVRWMG